MMRIAFTQHDIWFFFPSCLMIRPGFPLRSERGDSVLLPAGKVIC